MTVYPDLKSLDYPENESIDALDIIGTLEIQVSSAAHQFPWISAQVGSLYLKNLVLPDFITELLGRLWSLTQQTLEPLQSNSPMVLNAARIQQALFTGELTFKTPEDVKNLSSHLDDFLAAPHNLYRDSLFSTRISLNTGGYILQPIGFYTPILELNSSPYLGYNPDTQEAIFTYIPFFEEYTNPLRADQCFSNLFIPVREFVGLVLGCGREFLEMLAIKNQPLLQDSVMQKLEASTQYFLKIFNQDNIFT